MQIAWNWLYRGILALILFLSVRAGAFLYDYYSFEKVGVAKKTDWRIERIDQHLYAFSCSYTYSLKGSEYKGVFHFDKPQFSDEYVAKKHLEEIALQPWDVYVSYFDARASRLQHNFPFKELFHLALGLLALLYFRWLEAHLPERRATLLPQ